MRTAKSRKLHERAIKVIPGGSQTFSKNLWPRPIYIEFGQGSHVFDVDGNEYIDWPMALGPPILGHRMIDVFWDIGFNTDIVFSTPHEAEIELAEILIDLIPSAEMVRFGKNGADATAAAVRLARAHTGRELILAGGYHGAQDWYIHLRGAKGVPFSVARQCIEINPWNLKDVENKIIGLRPAAIIVEPTSRKNLQELQRLCRANNVVFILDEIITGFRVALGGCQSIWSIDPDLTCLGKAMANGFPLSAVCGRREIMEHATECFISSTFGGETLSLRAAITTIKILKTKDYGKLWRIGQEIQDFFKKEVYAQYISGYPGRPVLELPPEYHSAFQLHCLEKGVLFNGIHNTSFSHWEEDIERTLEAYSSGFSMLRRRRDWLESQRKPEDSA